MSDKGAFISGLHVPGRRRGNGFAYYYGPLQPGKELRCVMSVFEEIQGGKPMTSGAGIPEKKSR